MPVQLLLEFFRGKAEGRYDYGMVSLLGYIRNMDKLSLIDIGTIHSNGKILSTILVSTQVSIKKGSQVLQDSG